MKLTGQQIYEAYAKATEYSWPKWEDQHYAQKTYNTMAEILNEQEDQQSDEMAAMLLLMKQQQSDITMIKTVLAMQSKPVEA